MPATDRRPGDEGAREPRVFVAVPTRDMASGQLCAGLALRLVELGRRAPGAIIDIVAGYPVDRVRNQICRRFLESDADFLLMLDDDVVPPADVLDMARHGKDVVAGLCYAYLPHLGYYTVAYPPEDEDGQQPRRLGIGEDVEGRGLLEVQLAGTACMLIARRVLEGLEPPWFAMQLDDERLLIADSEDFYFCRKARAAGFSVWLDTDRPCRHHKALDLRASVIWAQEYASRRRLFGSCRDDARGTRTDERGERR